MWFFFLPSIVTPFIVYELLGEKQQRAEGGGGGGGGGGEFGKIFKNTFFIEHLRTTTSEIVTEKSLGSSSLNEKLYLV